MQRIETSLNLGTEYLSEYSAYFLGLLLANEKQQIEGSTYWVAPIRHNPKAFKPAALEIHYNNVREIASYLGKERETQMIAYFKNSGIFISKYNVGKKGFATLFKQRTRECSLEEIVSQIREPLFASEGQVIRCFLVGFFDGRSSYDRTAHYISIDVEEQVTVDLVRDALALFDIETNYNDSDSARERANSSATRRRKQLRIKNPIEFMSRIGLISETRFEIALENLRHYYNVSINHSNLLPGLKTVTRNY